MNIVTVCENCGQQRAGRHSDPCSFCDASSRRQVWVRADDFDPQPTESDATPTPTEPQFADKKLRWVEEYKALEKAKSFEQSKAWGSQITIRECEDKMAAIETQFQREGEDIRHWL